MGLQIDASDDRSLGWFWQFHRAEISHQAKITGDRNNQYILALPNLLGLLKP
jgi:hypothetical protein